MIKIKKLDNDAIVNERKDGDAGIDLSVINVSTKASQLFPERDSWYIIPSIVYYAHTGLSISLPEKTFGLIKPRSGMSKDHGLNVLAGVLDNSYRGEIIVIFTVKTPFSLHKGDRIAQLVPTSIIEDKIEIVDELDETERGDSGFGSSGK